MQRMILAFNFVPERVQALKMVSLLIKVPLKVIERKDMCQPLGALVGLSDIARTDEEYTGTDAQEEMLYLCGVNGPSLDRLLQGIKRSPLKQVALKAMQTPTNIEWTPIKLISELKQEHEFMTQRSKGQRGMHKLKQKDSI